MQTTIKINRLWLGKASVRDYVVNQAIQSKKDLLVSFSGNFMTIPWYDLDKGKVSKDMFVSKFDNKSYRLVDFDWKPDKKNQIKLI